MGPVLVLAGPGAGKTFCLIGRVGHLISAHRVPAGRICALTFTNRAAEEIQTRLQDSLGDAVEAVHRGTLHALCADILREHGAAIGIQRGFGIADEAYQSLVLRRLGIYNPGRRRWLLGVFGRHRLQGKALEDAGDAVLLQRYLDHLRAKNLIDFDDLVVRTAELFATKPEVAREVAAQWDYVLVDESQDLNPTQYDIVRTLAEGHRNIFAVGDDEQSIFAFTGADPIVLKRFGEDFGITDPIVLDKNRRCSVQIFQAARRLVQVNQGLFVKRLEADRPSAFEVTAFDFPDDDAEAAWIVQDLLADRAAHGMGWGDYAVLYRKHEAGAVLEAALIQAGIPCRLARSRALLDDPVIAQVVASIRVMRDPSDELNVERLAELVLPPVLMDDVRKRFDGRPFLDGLRAYGKTGERTHPDVRRAWRFIYHVENLGAMYRGETTLEGLVDQLLAQPLGEYRNPLEDRHEELSDPADDPAARRLAERLAPARDGRSLVWLERQAGLEIALRGMLRGAGVTTVRYRDDATPVAPSDVVLGPTDAGPHGLGLTTFKALQLVHSAAPPAEFTDYVAFDLETTDRDTDTCEVVEIGAARVRGGEVTETYHTLVKPGVPIAPGAQRQHGYSDADVAGAPSFAEVWPTFRAFVGDDVVVAHNGQKFDVPVLKRMAAGRGVDELVFLDSLPLARSLFRASAKLTDLADRFKVPLGRAHHALDDAVALAHIFHRLGREKMVRARKAALVNVLDYLGLALALDTPRLSGEAAVLHGVAGIHALGRFSDCLEVYGAEGEESPGAPSVDDVIGRLGGQRLLQLLRTEKQAEQRFPAAVARLRRLVAASAASSLPESVDKLLELVALSRSDGADVDRDRVNLLTLHATKGLEFSRVYIVGVEDEQMPGTRETGAARERELEEARRLLYVGMTRAMDRLVLTRVDRRAGKDAGGSQFLTEIGVVVQRGKREGGRGKG